MRKQISKNKPKTRTSSVQGKRVIIAMSGGIDSSVAAALLKKQGYEVVGVFMKFWSEPPSGSSPLIHADSNADLRGYGNRCCTPEAEKRARLVAEKLNIPFYVFNFEKEFKKKVVDYFLRNYKLGLTPNPCVVCNKEIKFGLLFKKMLSLDVDYIATGHYSRIKTQNSKLKNQSHNLKLKTFKLLKGKDKQKDQSYFLWKLNQKILKKTLFPIGDYTKTEVRSLAHRFKLPVLDVPESMEICFIQTTINDFLKKYLKIKPGKIIDTEGKTIGEHQGLWFYTIGQRKGLNLARDRASANFGGRPFYVLDKDIKKNILIVTQNKKDLDKKELVAKNINWIHPVKCCEAAIPLKAELFNRVKAKIRYRHEPASATVKGNKIIFDKPQRAITPGQSVVFYKGRELLGGATIDYPLCLK